MLTFYKHAHTPFNGHILSGSGIDGWKTLGDEVQACNRWKERMSGRPLPSILSIGVGNFSLVRGQSVSAGNASPGESCKLLYSSGFGAEPRPPAKIS